MNLLLYTSRRLFQTFPENFIHSNVVDGEIRKIGRKMPKKSTGGAGKEQKKSTTTETTGPVKITKEGHLAISIQVKPGAKVSTITDVSDEAVSVKIFAPPVDGEANTAIVKYFAELLNLKKADVSLKGGKSRQKIVTIDSSTGLTIERILAMLKKEQES